MTRATPTDAPGARRDAAIEHALGAWYDGMARDLPWRRTRDPYAIWVSEVMLQQTRVETVIPYFERFLARYPSAPALAAAEPDEVLSLWSGLGYYRRGRQLHAAAREVVSRHAGRVPGTVPELRNLSGVGRYTAGAIASIAFDRREPLVDGNVARVLARLEGVEDDVKSAAGGAKLWAIAARLVPAAAPGRFNQALMELGATVCTPRQPRCSACPVAAHCVAARDGDPARLPRSKPKKKPRAVPTIAAVVHHGDVVLLARRSAAGLFGGMWEPPMVEAAALAAALPLLARVGVRHDVELAPAGQLRHVLTHRLLDVMVVAGEAARRWRAVAPADARYDAIAWVDPASAAIGISTLARKVLSAASAARSATPRTRDGAKAGAATTKAGAATRKAGAATSKNERAKTNQGAAVLPRRLGTRRA